MIATVLGLAIVGLLILLLTFYKYKNFFDYAIFSVVVNTIVLLSVWATNFKDSGGVSVNNTYISVLIDKYGVLDYDSIYSFGLADVIDGYAYAGIVALLPFFSFLAILFLGTLEKFIRRDDQYDFVYSQLIYVYRLIFMALARFKSADSLALILHELDVGSFGPFLMGLQRRFMYGGFFLYLILLNSVTIGELLSELKESSNTRIAQYLSSMSSSVVISS